MLPQPSILVLDDYHMLDSQPIDQALAFLVERLPAQLHLVITTREDPSLPLARLRARGHMTELRTADLRFTDDEAAAFFSQVMGLNLSAEDIAKLEARTEGWIAGLQLAALSMQGRADISAFIQSFAGDHRYVLDYLLEEVLQRQPKEVRNFLLQTSILDRLHGPLCDAVTGQDAGNTRLEMLERGNFFIIPLDDQRQWYRYHHLFAGVLSVHLSAEQPDLVATLHRRASAWYEQHGHVDDAIRHALATQDSARAADLIELAAPAIRRNRREMTLLGWLRALPEELFHYRPVLSVHYAGALLSAGELESVEARLRAAELWLDAGANAPECAHERPAAMIVRDESEWRQMPGMIAVYRSGLSLVLDDVPATIRYARQALDRLNADDHLLRGAAMALLGLAFWRSGDLGDAYQSYAAGMAHLQRAGYIADAIGGALALADIRITQGRLDQAMEIYTEGLQRAAAHGAPLLRGTADMLVGISELRYERNDLFAAKQYLIRSEEQGEHTGFPQNPYRWRVAKARIRMAEGDLDGALVLLREAERRYVSDFFPNVRPIAAFRVRVWIAQGRWRDALDWAREQGLSAHDNPTYLREFEHITLARALLARAVSDHAGQAIYEAIGLLDRLLDAAEAGGRMGSVVEIRLLLSRAHQIQSDIPAALISLSHALTIAESEGYIRLFMDEGPPMANLLHEAAARGIRPSYTATLLVAFGGQKLGASETLPPASPVLQPLIEPLSQRELEVLRLLRTELSGPEIARTLVIGLSTVRTYTKNIYSKLNVNNRRAAVNRAIELGLI